MMSISRFVAAIAALAPFALAPFTPPVAAQGRTDYMNVESPQVHPIEVATVAGHDYLLVCNTPDNSVEIWDTDEAIQPPANRFLARVRTGQEPVSVRWNEDLQRFYTTNFLGDSITSVDLEAPGGPPTLSATVVQTDWVGDEPMDLAFFSFEETDPDGVTQLRHSLFVTHMTLDAFGWLDALTLQEIAPGTLILDAAVPKGADLDGDGLDDSIAIKEPRAIAIACGKLFILGMKGGNHPFFDFDLFSFDLTTGAVQDLGGIGSTNWNMAFASNDDLYIVGGEALNQTLRDEPNVAAAPTGFVKHMFYLVENACGPTPVIHRRDVNLIPREPQQIPGQTVPLSVPALLTSGPGGARATGGQAVAQVLTQPVKKGKALAQLTDLAIFERGDRVEKVFFTAFGSDRIGVLEPDASQNPDLWPRRAINMGVVAGSPNPIAAPRGLALRVAGEGGGASRLYSLNRGDNSVTIYDAVAETVLEEFALDRDPRPHYIPRGLRFLYDAKLSGNGFSSCGSCHTDGRTDGLAWDLGDPSAPNAPIPALLRDRLNLNFFFFPAEKEFIVTQTLQGLLNFEVDRTDQDWFTNAPYHWRGDRQDFLAFNGAFASLLGGSKISSTDMEDFEEAVNSIHYPGNPRQPLNRRFSGTFGTPNNPADGSGGLWGLKLQHIINSDGVGPCVGCHALPDGSNNRITEELAGPSPFPAAPNNGLRQPLETAQLRGLFQREARLDRSGSSIVENSPITGLEGLTHTGFGLNTTPGQDAHAFGSINAFNRTFFTGPFCGGPGPCAALDALNQSVHELDWGVGPLVGVPYTVTQANLTAPLTTTAFNLLETAAREANAGLAVQAWIGGVERGFWFDPIQALYVEEPGGATFTRAGLTALITASRDRLALHGTPLGSERRVASPTGPTSPLAGPAPSNLQLLPMTPNTAYTDVPQLTLMWQSPGNNQFIGYFAHTVRLFQHGLLQDGPPGAFGLPAVRHDAPRRFRVAGDDIRHGATLHIHTQADPAAGVPPNTGLPPGHQNQVTTRETVLPLYPTDDLVAGDVPVWETAVEAEPLVYYRLMLGGEFAPGVQLAFLDNLFQIPEPPAVGTFNPTLWNIHFIEVKNEDGTQANAGWVPITIQ